MYQFRLVALSLLICASPAFARDRDSHHDAAEAASTLTRTAPTASLAGHARSTARLAVDSNMDLGVGIYSVGGHFVRDRQRNGREPILGTTGQDNKIAAVGLSLRF